MSADRSFKQLQNNTEPPLLTAREVTRVLYVHDYRINVVGKLLGSFFGWQRYLRVAFFTAVAVAAFREEVVVAYLYLRTLVF